MIRLIVYMFLSLLVAVGGAWLIKLPGTISIELGTYRLQPSIGTSALILLVFMLAILLIWSLIRRLLAAPKILASRAKARNQRLGIKALSDGFIAIQAGDAEKARGLAREAKHRLPDNAAANLLEAKADLSLGHWGAARDQYRELIDNPATALAALSGLYEQAEAQNRPDAALTFAQKAHAIAPRLEWANHAVFEDYTREGNWTEALELVEAENAATPAEKLQKKHKKAVLHAAFAHDLEENTPTEALSHAQMAGKLLPDFVPAALIAARVHSSRGDIRKASSLLKRLWRQTSHPHAAALFAHAQPGISPVDRLNRISDLVPSPPPDQQTAIVVAKLAIAASEWAMARNALANFAPNDPSQKTCLAMAEIEDGQSGDQGRARQWLARAVQAPRDPIWTAEGITMEDWQPLSPVSSRFDAFEWKVPLSETFSERTQLPLNAPVESDEAEGRQTLENPTINTT